MKCKHCQNELEQGVTLCPVCGEENPAETKAELGAGKIALLVVLAVAAVAVIVALIAGGAGGNTPAETTLPSSPAASEGLTSNPDPSDPAASTPVETVPMTVPADGNPDDVTCQGSYSVTDEEMTAAAETVVATMGDVKLTNAELQIYYWMQIIDFLNQNGYYASYIGLDTAQPLDCQLSIDGELTWQQYFLDSALVTWVNYQAMCLEANASGFEMDQEYADYLAQMPDDLADSAASMGYDSVNAMIQADMGPGATMEGYLSYLQSYYLGYLYYGAELEKMTVTDAEIEAYFDAHAEEYQQNGLEKTDECYVDVRHILICPESAEGSDTYTEAEWAAAEKRANELLNEWLAANPTEDSFAAMAQEHSEDPGSASNGGLYEDVYVGQMVEPFEVWCFDAARQQGDYGIVKTTYGYHIMYFVGSDPVWKLTAEQDMMTEKGNEFLQSVLDKHPAEIDYSAIALGVVAG